MAAPEWMVSSRARDCAALGAGLVYPLGFAPFGLYPLPVLALAVLYLCLRGASAARGAWRGWLFGAGAFGLGVSWVQVSVHQFGLPLLSFSVTVTVLFVAAMALYPLAFGWLAARTGAGGGGAALVFGLPAAWTVIEWVRGWLLSGFPWLQAGYAQIDAPLAGYVPLGGVHAATFAVAASAALAVLVILNRARYAALTVLAALWLSGALLTRSEWTDPAGPRFEAALVQGNVAQAIKWRPSERERTLERYLSLSEPYWRRAAVLVWPETAVPAFRHRVGDFLGRLDALARETGTDVLLGLPVLDDDGERYYNSVIGLGASPGVYHKRHLVPFGEFMPLQGILGGVLDFLDIPMSSFSAGAGDQPLVHAGGWPVGISICYEDAFGAEVRDTVPAAAFLVNVSNDAWFGDSLAPHQHLEIARMRALETGRYLLRATNTGISAIIDPRGRIVTRAAQFEPAAIAAVVEPRAGATPYVRIGDWPLIGACMLAALGLFGAGISRSACT